VPLASAIRLKLAAVWRGIEKVIFVFVFSSLPWGFVRKCDTFRFLMSTLLPFALLPLASQCRPVLFPTQQALFQPAHPGAFSPQL